MASQKLTHAAFWDRMDRATRHVGKAPDWVKGSPINERPAQPTRGKYLSGTEQQSSNATTAVRQDLLPPRS
jgi:hypothetical protein